MRRCSSGRRGRPGGRRRRARGGPRLAVSGRSAGVASSVRYRYVLLLAAAHRMAAHVAAAAAVWLCGERVQECFHDLHVRMYGPDSRRGRHACRCLLSVVCCLSVVRVSQECSSVLSIYVTTSSNTEHDLDRAGQAVLVHIEYVLRIRVLRTDVQEREPFGGCAGLGLMRQSCGGRSIERT